MRTFLLYTTLAAATAGLHGDCIMEWCPVRANGALRAANPAAKVPLLIVPTFRNEAELDRTVREVSDPKHPRYTKYLSHDEIYAMIGNPEGTQAVLGWLRGAGLLANVTSSGYGVRAVGSVAAVEKLLGAHYQEWEHKTRTYGNSTEKLRVLRAASYEVPEAMRQHVLDVSHVSDFYENKVRPHRTEDTIKALREARRDAKRLGLVDEGNDPTNGLDDDDTFSGCTYDGQNICYGNVRPSTVWNAYGTTCTPTCTAPVPSNPGDYSTHGVYETGNFAAQSDLNAFFTDYMDNAPPPTLEISAGSNDPSQCSYGASACVEASLDVQYLSAVAPLPTLQGYWYSSETLADFAGSFGDLANAILNPGAPDVISISYGLDENALPVSKITAANTAFKAAGANGKTILVASGDAGASNYRGGSVVGNTKNCGANPSFPASSPWVTAVGATSYSPKAPADSRTAAGNLVYTTTNGGPEVASSGGNPYGNQVTTGGGFSCNFAAETYQNNLPSTYLQSGVFGSFNKGTASNCQGSFTYGQGTSNTFNGGGRGFPDIVALGWQYEIVEGGSPLPGIAGTSAAAPVAAGMFSLINAALKKKGGGGVGFVNPVLYQHAGESNVFNEVGTAKGGESTNACTTSGNGCCPSGFAHQPWTTVKWNAYTGLGSPKFSGLASAFGVAQGLKL